MRLGVGLCPALTEGVMAKLNAAGITNIVNFMQKDAETLASETSVSYKDLQSIRRIIHAHYAAFAVSGSEMLDEAVRSAVIISTGITSLDTLLGGGLMAGEIVEICGGWGVGKTSLCVHLAIHSALKLGFHTLYVDPTASVSSSRLEPIIEKATETAEEVEQALSCIQVVTPHDVWDLFQALTVVHQPHLSLRGEDGNSGKNGKKIKLVIVDSLPSFLSPLLTGSQKQGWGIINQLACTLKQISSEHHVAVVVVNSIVAANYGSSLNQWQSSHSKWKPALGRFWGHVPNTRVFLERIGDPVPSTSSCAVSNNACNFGSTLDMNATIWKSSRLKITTSQVSI